MFRLTITQRHVIPAKAEIQNFQLAFDAAFPDLIGDQHTVSKQPESSKEA